MGTAEVEGIVGVIIGRFQVKEFHEGHLRLIDSVKKKHTNVLILVGVSPAPLNKRNPLDYAPREMLLYSHYPDVYVMPVVDQGTDSLWSKQVDGIIRTLFPTRKAILYGGRDSFIPHYQGGFPTRELDFNDDESSATKDRLKIAEKPIDSADFRAGMIYAQYNNYPRISPAVDIAIVDTKAMGNPQVLLVRKPNEPLWRFPGGFVDRADESYERTARRELFEETGLAAEGDMNYVGSFNVDDFRVKGTNCAIFTSLFVTLYAFGNPKAADDVAECQWFTLKKDPHVMPVHKPLYEALNKWLNQ